MERIGFGVKWMNWIKWCVPTASFSILITGTTIRHFKSTRGLRQGDPISLYFFVMMMEAPSSMIKGAAE